MTTASDLDTAGSPAPRGGTDSPAQVVLVELPDCHLCEEAKTTLAALGRDLPLEVRLVEATSQEGRRLIARFRPTMAPLILLDGELFSSGRLSRQRLVSRLRARTATEGR